MDWKYSCGKCGGESFRIEEMRGSSGGFMAYMNVDNQIVTLVVCERCLYIGAYACRRDDFLARQGMERD